MQTLVFDTPKSVIASLKKLQYFNFEKEELGLLPPNLTKDSGPQGEVDLGFERACLVYYLASFTQNRQDLSFYYLGQLTDLHFDIIEEFTSKKDLSFYTAMLLLTHGDYDQVKAVLELKNVKKIIFYTEEGRSIVNCILKNDFKQMRKTTLDMFAYLESDAIMSENLGTLKKQIQTAFTQILLKNYTRVKISAVADFMISDEKSCA